MGIKVVGIVDRSGGLFNKDGYSLAEITHLFMTRDGNKLAAPNLIPFEQANLDIWELGAEVFIPAAGSRLVTKYQLDQMKENGLEVISCGQMFLLPIMIFS